MILKDIIIIGVIVLIIGAASFYIYKAKKNGQKCIGCPHACNCPSKAKAKSKDEPCCCGCNPKNQ